MGFDREIYGSYGDERTSQSTKIGSLTLGAKMTLPDGRIFRHAKAGGTTLGVALMVQTEDTVDNDDTQRYIGEAAAIGDKTIVVTLGASSVLVDQYADGYLYTESGTGEGYIYRVKANNSCDSVLDCTFTLEDGDGVQVALLADTSYCGLRVNPWKNVLLYEGTGTLVGQPAGIPPREVAANYYFWCQTRGPAMCLVDGSEVLGEPLMPSVNVDGAVEPFTASSAQVWFATAGIGWTMSVQGSTQYGPVYLTLE